MAIDKKIYEKISGASANTPDPVRAERNLVRFVELNPDKILYPYFSEAAGLFAVSQFLANYCIANPEDLFAAIREIRNNITKRFLEERAGGLSGHKMDINYMMKALRHFKKQYLLRITLRDITGETDIQSSMDELTLLAETIISISLKWSLRLNRQRFGKPADSAITLIALGKLGAEELNYSSDVDLIAVYDKEDGQTTGMPGPSGIKTNRISNHEFYCKVVELLAKLLSSQTEDGIVYRIDLRLRPQGQRGDVVLPLKAYQTYYESWGRTWERMALTRARPAAGDIRLGKAFMETIRPFVWRETVDYSEIEEIRGLKKKIDSTFARDDIKRGYGGIREAEFFVQTFQLLYGRDNRPLRTNSTLNAIRVLQGMRMVPEEDLVTLRENYLFLRRLEHYLQMKEDLQTHALPSSDEEMEAIARMMGFSSKSDFLADLRLRRMQTKNMYNSLLGTQEDVHAEALNLLEGKLNDEELFGYLSFRKVKNPGKCLMNMKSIREHMSAFRTMQERSLIREVMPQLLENALMAESPDRALAGLENLLTTYDIKTAHLTAIMELKELMTGITKIFSLSPYLTRIFLSSQYYLDKLIEEWSIVKSLSVMEGELRRTAEGSKDFNSELARYRRFEEVRSGMLFLPGILKTEDLFRGLSHLAEAIIKVILDRFGCNELSVIAFGKLGGREMTFGSDIDIVFVSGSPEAMTLAEKIMKVLTSYSDMGLLYSVDTRLRPDGSKGILVKDIEGYRSYYLKNARNWEIQALLKARPVGGNEKLSRSFMNMAKDVILQRGRDIRKEDITAMRARIIKELSHEAKGMDIKLGSGGIKEIEFYVQFLQLHHAQSFPEILVQNTLAAINRLAKKQILSPADRDTLCSTYEYYRKLQTFLRLNEEQVIAGGSYITELSAKFMDHKTPEEFLDYLRVLRDNVLTVTGEA
ncbi:MAG TPA: bifunctional [glutamate--ammonia ligase]-adenylyl-L-tyrosine phosphorylase/[glutamate--ammonia-ligase] adenylyltransferase [Nitrospirae bacterium]|nr:glutamate-ammonia-ligase adenylyltransferase [bacterium BMS3Abin06]HDH12772.1 bifunctional [glutamate--ammonia ligase]-adenylyl-L-tyrosine phosphorylase/[glutamate--ammonia-ligase] adenylyltransferase [Nitrospirota bacterium]HDZ03330.1 bifunctional [glutamate--ammonia ligase]-adenylyl-L-tyrosine phosphorylase/[glutamate--ammonia-ligase] adenylyltransferase [Nitrospirota bacterium]